MITVVPRTIWLSIFPIVVAFSFFCTAIGCSDGSGPKQTLLDSPKFDVDMKIAAGDKHTCALKTGGVKCWGSNGWGQLGDGNKKGRSLPVDVFGLTSGVRSVAAGWKHTCALLSAGGMKCWGDNSFGQLGNGSRISETTPVDVSCLASGVEAIAAGGFHTCALLSKGGVKCWGITRLIGSTEGVKITPVGVSGLSSDVLAIAAGSYHTCALLSTGGVKCWGLNELGQLGDGTTNERTSPVTVSGLASGVQAIAAGGTHTCAALRSGGVKCWGKNYSGFLGNRSPTKEKETTPVDVSGLGSGVRTIAAGYSFTCALLDSGGVKCWGYNGDGELGNGSRISETTPVDVSGLASGVDAIAAGANHACALLHSGGIKCWGENDVGQLGDGTTYHRDIPLEVAGF